MVLFRLAYVQVEQRVDHFKKTLKERLLEMPSTLEEQKKIIRYLLILEPDTDAGWTCLSAHYHWLMGLLWDSQQKHHKLGRIIFLEILQVCIGYYLSFLLFSSSGGPVERRRFGHRRKIW